MRTYFDYNGNELIESSYDYKQTIRIDNINDFFKIINLIWWKFALGKTVKMQWPSGLTEPDQYGNCINSSDPNLHWRSWLEEYVGKQYIDWDWSIGWSNNCECILIQFRKSKIDLATQFVLKYYNEVN